MLEQGKANKSSSFSNSAFSNSALNLLHDLERKLNHAYGNKDLVIML